MSLKSTSIAQLAAPLAALGLALTAPCSPALAQATVAENEAVDQAARDRFAEGRAAFAAGRYPESLVAFRRAFELSGRIELLFNMAAAAELVPDEPQAIEAYRRFLAEVTTHPRRPEAERRLALLEARAASHTTAAAAEPAPEIDATMPSEPETTGTSLTVTGPSVATTHTTGGWVFSWVGLGLTAAAGGGAALSWALANDLYNTCSTQRSCSTGEIDTVQLRLDMTNVMLITTGVLAAATVVLFVVEAPHEESASVALHLNPLGLELRGWF